MIQILMLGLSGSMAASACYAMSGKMNLTRHRKLAGGSAFLAGFGLIIGAVGLALFALVILPTIRL